MWINFDQRISKVHEEIRTNSWAKCNSIIIMQLKNKFSEIENNSAYFNPMNLDYQANYLEE